MFWNNRSHVKVHPGELWVSKQRVHIVLEASKSAGAKGDVSKICGFVHPLKRIPCYLMRNAKIPQTRIIPLIFIVDKKSDVICFARQIVSCILPKLMIMLHYHEFWTITASFGEIPARIRKVFWIFIPKFVRAPQKNCQIAACKSIND